MFEWIGVSLRFGGASLPVSIIIEDSRYCFGDRFLVGVKLSKQIILRLSIAGVDCLKTFSMAFFTVH